MYCIRTVGRSARTVPDHATNQTIDGEGGVDAMLGGATAEAKKS